MTIEIIEVKTITHPLTDETFRAVEIIITSGTNSYLWSVGGLPSTGNLQTILDAREAELFAAAQKDGRQVDLYEFTLKKVLKAFALVTMDEINILRQQAGLPLRTANQIETALKNKLKGL